MMPSDVERITALEVQMMGMTHKLEKIEDKLDDLLNLRQRGIGAFWLASSLFGTTLLGVVTLVIGFFRHA